MKRDNKGRFIKGLSYSTETQFKKGQHWREKKPFWDKDWLHDAYVIQKKSMSEIAKEFGIRTNAIHFWIKKHNINTRTPLEARKGKYVGLFGVDNPMWNKKGELNPNWKGGISTERQNFYTSKLWKEACSQVWKRDNGICRRCGVKKNSDIPFHIHHIKSFSDKDLRADLNNLMLVCEPCHYWIHSRKNINKEYIKQ